MYVLIKYVVQHIALFFQNILYTSLNNLIYRPYKLINSCYTSNA